MLGLHAYLGVHLYLEHIQMQFNMDTVNKGAVSNTTNIQSTSTKMAGAHLLAKQRSPPGKG